MAWILRVLAVVLLALGRAWAGEPAPAELPPADFTARQYIDSTGCVFLRDDAGRWAPRVARDGSQLCGYPPSLSARGRPPAQILAGEDERGRSDQIEQVLNELVITNLKPGELVSDPRPREVRVDHGPEPAPQGPLEELQAEVSASAELRQQMAAGIKPNLRLCELLGYDGKRIEPKEGVLGQDPTQGFCGSLPQADLARLAFARPAGSVAATPPEDARAGQPASEGAPPYPVGAEAAPTETVVAEVAPTEPVASPRPRPKTERRPEAARIAADEAPRPRAAGAGGSVRTSSRGAGPPGEVPDIAARIPPGARFVHVGSYSVQANADAAGRRVLQMGMPVSRAVQVRPGRDVTVVIAGPFEGREAVVRALDQLRKAGYSDAYAR